jgi:hypothetical protein
VLQEARFGRVNPDDDATKPCVYVGMTGLTPEQRLTKHLAGSLQLVDQHIQGFFVLPVAAESAVLGGLAGFRVVEGLDGEGHRRGLRTWD